MAHFVPCYAGSRLYIAPGGENCFGGFLLSTDVTTLPDSLTVEQALYAYHGWFVQLPATAITDLAAFEQKAQVWFRNSARKDALAAWFTSIAGLTATVLFARKNGTDVTLLRTAEVPFGNFALSLPKDSTIVASAQALTFSRGTLLVTPIGERTPQPFALDHLGLELLNDAAPNNVLSLAFSVTSEAASDVLDIGLRSFSAPAEGGYTQTALYRIFNLQDATSQLTLQGTLDPLAPCDTTRSFLQLSSGALSLPTYYQSAAGAAVEVKPLASAGLVFTERLAAVDASGQPVILRGNQSLYLTPAGEFEFLLSSQGQADATSASLQNALMGGLSSVEYFKYTGNPILAFTPHQDAFARTLQNAAPGRDRVFGTLTGAGKTSWVTLQTAQSSEYFAQPDSSVLHQAPDAAADTDFLTYLPVSVGDVEDQKTRLARSDNGDLPPVSFPLAPYRSIKATNISGTDIRNMETQVLSPKRRTVVQTLIQTGESAGRLRASLPSPPFSTTPQGLLLALGEDATGLTWQQLTLGQSSAANTPPHRADRLLLSQVNGELKSALQTNQLFLVITGAGIMSQCASIPYSLTAVRQRQLALQITDPDVNAKLAAMVPTQWPDLASLRADLAARFTPEQLENVFDTVRNALGDFSLFVADWEFDLSPWRWVNYNTLLLFKFCNKKLSQLVDDTEQWADADRFNSSADGTRQRIQAIFAAATERVAAGDGDLSYFVNTVMESESWNGVLALNAQVPLTGLPPQLEGLAAGIDVSRFQAHHIGISVTPIATGQSTWTSHPSSVFGLIDYEDSEHLSGNAPYDFKVLSLKVAIANSGIVSFSSKIELLINQLFEEPATQYSSSSGNNLLLYGVYQKSGISGSYLFTTADHTTYGITSQILDAVGIRAASFVTASGGKADAENSTTRTTFALNGTIGFLQQPQFDLLSYGAATPNQGNGNVEGLAYSGLTIDMTFDPATPQYRQFTFNAQPLLPDANASQVRAQSLAAHFPMKLTALIQGTGDVTPDKMAYMPVDSPLNGIAMTAPWFGLQYELDLGSAGALAAKIDFTAGLLLAWSPASQTHQSGIYIGLHLPGVKGGERAIPIEGVLKLVFADVTFLVDPPTYILKLGDIALKLLALSFPPNGQIDLLMFGNPDAQTSGALGWYAAWVKNGADGAGGKQVQRLTQLHSESALSQLQQRLLAAQRSQ